MRSLSLSVAAVALGFAATGTLVAQGSPAAPRGVSDELRFTSISAGGSHTCGLTATGQAYCWGRNEVGQLGDSSNTDRPTPVPVLGGIVFRQITAGAHHTCGVSTDDEAFCWGGNGHGQLGNGGRANITHPFRVAGDLLVVLIAAGAEHTCATRKHWDQQDRALCWGSNEHGQLGDMGVEDVSLPSATFGVIRYASLATGDRHTCGATIQGKVFCWGANERGQLGNATSTLSRVPFPIRMNRRATFRSVAAGAAHSCGLTSEGYTFCWGDNATGQSGTGKGGRVLSSPTALRDSAGFAALSAGGDVTCGLRRDGSASCWGSNAAAQFGTAVGPGSPVPAPALPGSTWTALSLGRAHGCGVRPDGAGVCWGRLEP